MAGRHAAGKAGSKARQAWDKLEEATGGMHKPVAPAGDQQQGNFEHVGETGHEAETK